MSHSPARRSRRRSEDGASALLPLTDSFSDERPQGMVIGSRAPSGALRRGADRERSLGVDHGALRIPYLHVPGWGRAGVAYGPYRHRPGLALMVSVLNGLSTSQTPSLPEGRREAIRRWLRSLPRPTFRRPQIRENLAIGWFDVVVPTSPAHQGAGILAAAGEGALGELRVVTAGRSYPVVTSFQNVPVTYVVVRRERDTIVYAASFSRVHGLPPYPGMRPLGILPHDGRRVSLYAGVHQSVLGEVKYQVDTRVYAVRIAEVHALGMAFGSAHAADDLPAGFPVAGAPAERGGSWSTVPGDRDGRSALLQPGGASGLIRLTAGPSSEPVPIGVVWRAGDTGCRWSVTVDGGGARLHRDGTEVAFESRGLRPGTAHSIQVIDDGKAFAVSLDMDQLFGGLLPADDSPNAGVGLWTGGGDNVLPPLTFEAHPREVRLPSALDLGPVPPAVSRPGCVVDVARDSFEGQPGDLAGHRSSDASGIWRRELGDGVFDLSGCASVRVRADRERPNPGRTIYGLPWKHPAFADVSVTVIPPGKGRGEGHRARGGLAFWQDAGNHLVLNNFLDDVSVGVSISAFLRAGGYERMYEHDATWSNVGDRIQPGVPYRLRVVFDGERFEAFVDDELVLYRALVDYRPTATALRITSVGLVANWEWGDDTGSEFRDFLARGPGGPVA